MSASTGTTGTAAGVLRLRVGPARLLLGRRTLVLWAVLAVLLAAGAVVSLTSGTVVLTLREMVSGLLSGPVSDPAAGADAFVVWSIRLPRTVTAVAVGMALGAAGAVFQSVSRNALGSPDIIGFTTGAATGAVAQIVLFNRGPAATALAAVLTGLATSALVYLLARDRGRTGGHRLVLTGIGVGAMLGAVNTILLAHGDLDLAVRARLWLSGSLNARTWQDALPVVLGVVVLLPVLAGLSRRLDILEMGDDQASQLGVSAERVRQFTMGAGVVLTAVAVAAAGPIAFIALAAPQLARRLTRTARVQVPTAALMGGTLLLAADLLSVHLPVNAALPVGLTTGLIGGCYLLWLLTRQRVL